MALQLQNNIDTVVIIGSWNIAIFTPEWVKSYIFDDSKTFKVQFPSNLLGSSLKFLTEEFSFNIFGNRLQFQLISNTDSAAKKMVSAIRKICQTLPHTPVKSLGINFVFKPDSPYNIGEIPHHIDLIKAFGPLESTELTRTFKVSDKELLNFKIIKNGDNVLFDINDSYQVPGALSKVTNILVDNAIILTVKKKIENALITIYNDK